MFIDGVDHDEIDAERRAWEREQREELDAEPVEDALPEGVEVPEHWTGSVCVFQYAAEVYYHNSEGAIVTSQLESARSCDEAIRLVGAINSDGTGRKAVLRWREVILSATEWK